MNESIPVITLEPEESWSLLRTAELGRVVTKVGDTVDIFPVNYVVDGDSIVFRTAEGTKLLGLVISDIVLFEVDSHSDDEAWSVIIRGRAEQIHDSEVTSDLEKLELRPWIPTVKQNWIRVVADQITGRQFRRGPEPEPTPDAA